MLTKNTSRYCCT